MSEKRYRLLRVRDTVSGAETTILLERVRFPSSDHIVFPRETEHLVFHQIGGSYDNLEDFDREWNVKPNQVENKIACPKCGEPMAYFTPKLDDFVNFTCIDILDARKLANALVELLEERGNADG